VAVGDSGVFDADYYADNNQDVEAVCGRDFNLLWQHYTLFGVNEGRLPFAPNTDWQAVLATANTTTTNTEATQQTQTEQTQTTVTPTVSTSDFLAQNGLSVTPQGTVNINHAEADGFELKGIPTIVSVADVASSQAGYTDTIAQFTYTAVERITKTETTNNNIGENEREAGSGIADDTPWYCKWNANVFDKNSGTVLGNYRGSGIIDFWGDKSQYIDEKEGAAAQYGCTIATEAKYDYDTGVGTITITVHHPSSYDGTAIMFGPQSFEGNDEIRAISGNSFTILNTPYSLSLAKIFTATNN
jgi:hypothetical protein